MSRNIRRHHLARLKRKRKFYFGNYATPISNPRDLGVVAATPHRAGSCFCCNRRRKHWGPKFGEHFEIALADNAIDEII